MHVMWPHVTSLVLHFGHDLGDQMAPFSISPSSGPLRVRRSCLCPMLDPAKRARDGAWQVQAGT